MGLPRLYLDLDLNRPTEYAQVMRGTLDMIQVAPGLQCRIDNAEVTAPFREISRMSSRQVILQFRLKSPSLVRYPEQHRYENLAPHCALIMMPVGESKTETFEQGQQDVVVSLHCGEAFWRELVDGEDIDLPDWCYQWLAGKPVTQHQTLPLTPAMREAAGAIVNTDSSEPFYNLFLQAKCQELIWLSLKRFMVGAEDVTAAVNLSRTDSARIVEIKKLLDQGFPQIPSLAALAAEQGLSDWKLNRGFKSLYGVVPSEYLLGLRMQKAQQLLMNSALTITAIALDVGYEFPSNFSKAFKLHTGLSPREYRGTTKD